jgi:hypothetical protein
MRWVALGGILVAVSTCAGLAQAQAQAVDASDEASPATPAPPLKPGLYTHDGFYLRFAIGPGAYVVGKSSISAIDSGFVAPSAGKTDSGIGVSEIFALGGTLPGGVVLGGAISAIVAANVDVGNYGFLVDWFPDPRGGWHVGGLLGLALVRDLNVSVTGPSTGSSPSPRATNFGLGLSVLGGYDAWLTPQFSMGVNLMATTAAFVQQSFDGGSPGAELPSYGLTPIVGGVMVSVLYH